MFQWWLVGCSWSMWSVSVGSSHTSSPSNFQPPGAVGALLVQRVVLHATCCMPQWRREQQTGAGLVCVAAALLAWPACGWGLGMSWVCVAACGSEAGRSWAAAFMRACAVQQWSCHQLCSCTDRVQHSAACLTGQGTAATHALLHQSLHTPLTRTPTATHPLQHSPCSPPAVCSVALLLPICSQHAQQHAAPCRLHEPCPGAQNPPGPQQQHTPYATATAHTTKQHAQQYYMLRQHAASSTPVTVGHHPLQICLAAQG